MSFRTLFLALALSVAACNQEMPPSPVDPDASVANPDAGASQQDAAGAGDAPVVVPDAGPPPDGGCVQVDGGPDGGGCPLPDGGPVADGSPADALAGG